jgi:peptidyl-prolyl cis-trans isomerase D
MLDTLRANARSTLTYVLFGIIIVVFVVSFGPGSCGGRVGRQGSMQPQEEVARVDGETISAQEWEQQYGALFRAYQQQAGQSFTRELADRLGLRRVAADQLVERVLLRQEAARQGIVVGDDDLERAITENPAFQAGGKFDYEYYQRAVTNSYGSATRFEQVLRGDLAVQKLLALLRQTAKISDDEVKEAWLADADKVNVEFVRFPVSAAATEVKVTPADAEAFAKANADAVKQRYEASKARYDKPKRVKARHVLVKIEQDATPAAVEAAQAKANEALARVKKGEDFAKVAKELSDDPGSKDRGGDVGEFGPGVMAPEFEHAAFGAKPGDLVGPVRTQFGFHVIKVDGVQEAQSVSFDAVKNEVARELLQEQRAKELAKKHADEALARAKAGRSLAELFPAGAKAAKLGGTPLQAEETGLYGASATLVPRVGVAPELQKAALAGTPGQVLGEFDTAGGPIVAQLKARQKADPAQFEAKKAEYAERLRARREAQVESAFVKALRERADVKVNDKLAGPSAEAARG